MTSDAIRKENADLTAEKQEYGADPLAKRETDHYRAEYVKTFVEKWDELIDWDARAASEGDFFIDILRSRGADKVLDVAAGTGFHSVRLTEAGFDVTTIDGSAAMLAQAFENAKKRNLILKTTQADWRWLNRDIQGKADAIVCLGNSFTHLFDEMDRRRALAEFYAALKHDGILILDQRNYDAILDNGFSTKHKYYYCGDRVTAEPEYFDDGLIRFKYSFPDASSYTLNMFPLRKNYVRKLLREAGFERVHTYGDFEADYEDHEPDFLVHVAEKSVVRKVQVRKPDEPASEAPAGSEIRDQIRAVAEDYYDSDDADAFYHRVWGGEDIHIGLYEETDKIKEASRRTVEEMVSMLEENEKLTDQKKVLDIGAGYGGAARYLAKTRACQVACLNVSETQNDTNRYLNRRQKLNDLVSVIHGTFEEIPGDPEAYDIVWSQDAILHSGDREQVFREVDRVLKPGGSFIFTDPMEADDCPEGVLQPVYDRIHLSSLGSIKYYKETAAKLGFELVEVKEMTHNLRTHYARVGEELKANYDELAGLSSKQYLDRMIVGLDNWVKAADNGWLAWGILHFRKPAKN